MKTELMENVVFPSLMWLALGAFAIGTEGFMISGILPGMARDLGVSLATAGQLVTIFAFAYAVGSPIIAVVTANLPRRRLLVGAMAVFSLSNLLAAFSPNYAILAAARVLLALSAGTFMPAAAGYASMTIEPARRGRALAFIYSGTTIALVIGVPLGTLMAARLDWRATFLGVAALGLVAWIGIAARLRPAPNPPAIGARARLAVAGRPEVLKVLALTVTTLVGAFCVNTYFGAYLETVFGISPAGVALALFVVGVAGACGNTLGGYAADAWDRRRFLVLGAGVIIFAFVALSALAEAAPSAAALGGVMVAIVLWALFGWSFPSVQQTRLVSIDPQLAPVTLSLNSSAVYLGAGLGAALGALATRLGSVAMIGVTGAACEFVALGVLLATMRPAPVSTRASSCRQAALAVK